MHHCKSPLPAACAGGAGAQPSAGSGLNKRRGPSDGQLLLLPNAASPPGNCCLLHLELVGEGVAACACCRSTSTTDLGV